MASENAVEMRKMAKRWGIADSIVLMHARSAKPKVVTGDQHFRDIKEATFIKNKGKQG